MMCLLPDMLHHYRVQLFLPRDNNAAPSSRGLVTSSRHPLARLKHQTTVRLIYRPQVLSILWLILADALEIGIYHDLRIIREKTVRYDWLALLPVTLWQTRFPREIIVCLRESLIGWGLR